MKLRKITAACALACASMAVNAAPLTGAFDTPDITIYLTGASAPQNFLGALAAGLFQGVQGTDWFAYRDTSGGANFRAYFGQTLSAGVPAAIQNKKVLIVNRAKGGSIFGVNPLARGQGIATMKLNSVTCTAAVAPFNFQCPEVGSDLNVADVNNQIPDMGVSDVEPTLFKAPLNVEFGAVPLVGPELTVITSTVKNTAGVMFGAPATTKVTSLIGNISTANAAALLSGTITDWNLVDKVAFPVGTNVTICRRAAGSGTQATYNAYFNKFPCSTGNVSGSGSTTPAAMVDSFGYDGAHAGTALDPILIDPTAGYTVVDNPSSGAVRNCLIAAQNGTDLSFVGADGLNYKVQFSLVGGSSAAFGTLSLDSKGNTGFGAQWNFLNLDGIAPTQANLTETSYPLESEQVMMYRAIASVDSTGSVPNGNAAALAGLQKTLADEFIKRASDPAVLATISNVNVRDSVAALPPTFTPTLDGAGVVTNKVMKGSRLGNTCSPIQKFF